MYHQTEDLGSVFNPGNNDQFRQKRLQDKSRLEKIVFISTKSNFIPNFNDFLSYSIVLYELDTNRKEIISFLQTIIFYTNEIPIQNRFLLSIHSLHGILIRRTYNIIIWYVSSGIHSDNNIKEKKR